MSKQPLSLKNDWEKVKENFQEHFKPRNLEITGEKIEYRSNSERLAVWRDGKVSGSMPLHSTDIKKAGKIRITDSEIKIISENTAYTFKR